MQKKISIILIAIVSFIMPWIFSTLFIEPFEYIKNLTLFGIILVLGIFWVINLWKTRQLKILKNPLNFPLVLWVLFNIISTLFSISTQTSIWGLNNRMTGGLISTILLSLFFFFVVNLIEKESEIKYIIRAIFLSSTIIALITLFKALGLLDEVIKAITFLPEIMKQSGFSFLGNLTQFIVLIGVMIPIGLQSIITNLKQKQNLIFYTISTFILILSFNTIAFMSVPQWSAIVAIIVVYITSFVLIGKSIRVWMRSKKLLAILASTVVISVIFVIVVIPWIQKQFKVQGVFTSNLELKFDPSWYISTKNWSELPLRGFVVGSGPDTFVYAFNKYKGTALAGYEYNKSLFNIMELMSDVGLLGTVIYLIILYAALKFIFKNLLKDVDEDKKYWVYGLAASSFIAITANFVTFSLISSQYLMWLMLVMCIAGYYLCNPMKREELVLSIKMGENKLTASKDRDVLPYVFAGIFGIIFIGATVLISINMYAEYKLNKARNKEVEALGIINDINNGNSKFNKENKQKLINVYKQAYSYAKESIKTMQRDYSLRNVALYASNLIIIDQRATEEEAGKTLTGILTNDEILQYSQDTNVGINTSSKLDSSNYKNYETGAGIYFKFYILTQGSKQADVQTQSKLFLTQAESLARSALQLNPTSVDSYLVLGQILALSSDSDKQSEAQRSLETAYILNPLDFNNLNLLESFYISTGKLEEAVKLYQALVELITDKQSDVYKAVNGELLKLQKMLDEKNIKEGKTTSSTSSTSSKSSISTSKSSTVTSK